MRSPVARSARLLSDALGRHLAALERTRTRLKRLTAADHIARRDIEQVYAGLFIGAVTSFERFLEDLFLGLLVRSLIPGAGVRPRADFHSYRVARDIILGNRSYVDWLPYQWTEDRANAFFTRGRPFSGLTTQQRNSLKHCVTLRNALAHRSDHARQQFERELLGGAPLPLNERTPAGFLRSVFRVNPTQTRFQNLTSELHTIATSLTV